MASSMNVMFLKRLQSILLNRPQYINIHRKKHGFLYVPPVRGIQERKDIFEEMEAKEIKLKWQPGAVRRHVVRLPRALHAAVSNVLQEYKVDDLVEHSKRLQAFLKVRKHNVTPEEYEDLIAEKIKHLQKQAKEGESEDTQDPEKLRAEAIRILQPVCNWSPINYTGAKVIQYLGARLTADYSGIHTCLREINFRDPDFSPMNVLDFGSGLGTTIWATTYVFKTRKTENYVCVDHSLDMNTVARLLLQGGEKYGTLKLPVHFLTNMPSDEKNKFDLVTCTYTLMEFESKEKRLKLVESLWNMTGKYLVIVEKGGKSGFKLLNEAREHLLKLSEDSKEGHIFAPCPHQEACPKAAKGNFCFFEANYSDMNIFESDSPEKEWFSYIIFKVGPKSETDKCSSLPRIISKPHKEKIRRHCYLCCSDGKLRHVIFSESLHGKKLYRCSRTAMWGDMLPVSVNDDSEKHNSHNFIESNVNKQSLHSNIEDKVDLTNSGVESSLDFQSDKVSYVHDIPNEDLTAHNHLNEELASEDYLKEESSVDNIKESPADDNEELSVNIKESSVYNMNGFSADEK